MTNINPRGIPSETVRVALCVCILLCGCTEKVDQFERIKAVPYYLRSEKGWTFYSYEVNWTNVITGAMFTQSHCPFITNIIIKP